MKLTVLYIALMALALILSVAGCGVPALALGVVAGGVAMRQEVSAATRAATRAATPSPQRARIR